MISIVNNLALNYYRTKKKKQCIYVQIDETKRYLDNSRFYETALDKIVTGWLESLLDVDYSTFHFDCQ